MNSKKIYEILDRDIRLNYKSKTEFADKVGVSKQRLSNILFTLEKNKRNILNTTFLLLRKSGYEITIKKVNRNH